METREFCTHCGAQRDLTRDSCWRCGSEFPTPAPATAIRPAAGVPEPGPPAVTAAEGTGTAPKNRRALVALSAALALAVFIGAVAFVLTRSEGEALALKFTQGRDYRYRMQMTLEGRLSASGSESAEPFSQTFDMTFAMHVASLDPQGTATIDLEMDQGDISVNGDHQDFPSDFKSRIRITKDGRLLSDDGALSAAGGTSGLSVPGFDQLTPLLADHPVHPGDTWSTNFDRPFPLGEGVMRYTTRNTFLRYEAIGGIRTAVIRSDLALPLDWKVSIRKLLETYGQSTSDLPPGSDPTISYGGRMSMSMTNWFDPAGGQQVKSTARGNVDMRLLFTGFPAEEGAPHGELRMLGTMKLDLQRLS